MQSKKAVHESGERMCRTGSTRYAENIPSLTSLGRQPVRLLPVPRTWAALWVSVCQLCQGMFALQIDWRLEGVPEVSKQRQPKYNIA